LDKIETRNTYNDRYILTYKEQQHQILINHVSNLSLILTSNRKQTILLNLEADVVLSTIYIQAFCDVHFDLELKQYFLRI
jgi:hypothetical protein